MDTNKFDFGMVGLGVMGRNFLLNVADHGFSALGLDLDAEKAKALDEEGAGRTVKGTTSTEEFVAGLKTPRRIMLLVPAGKVVDSVINSLLPHLDQGDMIIDGGNSHFPDTERRNKELQEKGFYFVGAGVSGGAEGARRGPSIMPGGNPKAYEHIRPVLEAVAAKVNGEPCVAHMGRGAAGHYVKMVHNGIEYGLMQLIAEAYDLLKKLGGLTNEELHRTFARWNEGRLQSFLIEITAAIFAQKDDLTDGDLVDGILDKAKQKGTGKWTSQNAMDLGIPIPTIDAAVTMRGLSALKDERSRAAAHYPSDRKIKSVEKGTIVSEVEQALYFAFIITYAQGLSLLDDASKEHDYGCDMEAIARIWRGGCIIRAALLEDIRKVYRAQPDLTNMLLSNEFKDELAATEEATRSVLKKAIDAGIPTLTLSSTLNYFDAYRSERLPLNLVQAQRDFFGSHTYERLDREGIFHTEWGS
ncbi:NADP-dependent phosphogluconate dehydrogenase [Flavilitoribacter nigricans]|uniref:6-phosphogluconate dehydrogenase, decarboxylating n=1 Tax=Flavilitoribacter nigricans (strain ATCC 23147 / DSM 23189 / NBRC 102662 / NCIMB 1420 / SS-2) TaxID=1122177 RepID=A0A2D0NCJ4_FLAN2|nr:NADP-dependent phosphogluconate dehydrogenase [Flavilitoribacter nigricans]PHN05493.1 phosphogluconate dehydrogenase (NADP(+)-dependent, decarboxylating) [Flavilitoribacter nigricans DSM 23189 = NBRC 102662]